MTKTKKALSILTSAAIACCALAGNVISVYAEASKPVYELTTPEGYEVVEVNSEHVCYRNIENHYQLFYYEDFKYSFAHLAVNDAEEWSSIYEKYEAEITPYHYSTMEGVFDNEPATWVNFYDILDEGDTPYDAASVADKTDIIESAISEAYDAGILMHAEYSAFRASSVRGDINDLISVYNYTGAEDELRATVSEYYPEAAVFLTQNGLGEDVYIIKEFTSRSVEEMEELCSKIEELYADSSADYAILRPTDGEAVSSGTVNVLNKLEETACDIDQNGTVEITDATAILESYANAAAGIAAASEENPMDVNGDGTVGIDDASFVLGVYAELAAGLR